MYAGVKTPSCVVGIDFGQTCTGVSYINLSVGSETVRWIQKWPGRTQANENKVPTVLVYPHGSNEPSSWGFQSETLTEQTASDRDYKEWFKTYLDLTRLRKKQAEDPEDAPQSFEEVEKWYEDYLKRMYDHIEFKLTPELFGTSWEGANIEFIFSVPTTWEPYPTVEAFRGVIERAGFGKHPGHSVVIGLTEAEAAAVHTSIEAAGIFKEREILLVADVGGGTTDLSVLRVNSSENGALNLEQLDVVFGETIGSAAIDYEFEKLCRRRLDEANRTSPLGIDPDDAAWEMMKSREFQNVKCDHGSPSDTPVFSVAVSQLARTHTDTAARIANGEMSFDREELGALFDKQVDKLFRLIDAQLQRILNILPAAQVNHLVLSGGLGNSPYIQKRLKLRYGSGLGYPSNAANMHVRTAPDPQLAVCKGLVADRVRNLKVGKSVLSTRCCRKSFGTLCKVLYDRKNPDHIGKPTHKDPYSGKLYIVSAIAWFIKKGRPIDMDAALTRKFCRKIAPGDPRRQFSFTVVSSSVDTSYLPTFVDSNTDVLCEVEADLATANSTKFKEKNRHFWSRGGHYLRVDYEVKVMIGPADLSFELWFDGEKLSKDQPIKVEWAPMNEATENQWERKGLMDQQVTVL